MYTPVRFTLRKLFFFFFFFQAEDGIRDKLVTGVQTCALPISTHVFSFRGKPLRQVNTKAWREALKKVGIENFRWHDLRHTWASWHVQAGTPLHVPQELGGWECVEMVRKYAHLSTEHLADYVDRLSSLRL